MRSSNDLSVFAYQKLRLAFQHSVALQLTLAPLSLVAMLGRALRLRRLVDTEPDKHCEDLHHDVPI